MGQLSATQHLEALESSLKLSLREGYMPEQNELRPDEATEQPSSGLLLSVESLGQEGSPVSYRLTDDSSDTSDADGSDSDTSDASDADGSETPVQTQTARMRKMPTEPIPGSTRTVRNLWASAPMTPRTQAAAMRMELTPSNFPALR